MTSQKIIELFILGVPEIDEVRGPEVGTPDEALKHKLRSPDTIKRNPMLFTNKYQGALLELHGGLKSVATVSLFTALGWFYKAGMNRREGVAPRVGIWGCVGHAAIMSAVGLFVASRYLRQDCRLLNDKYANHLLTRFADSKNVKEHNLCSKLNQPFHHEAYNFSNSYFKSAHI